MAVVTRNIHCCLERDHCKGNAWNPADEADNGEDCKDCEHDSSAPEMLVKVVDRGSNCQCDVQNPSDPDELLGEVLCGQKVCPGEDEADGEDECEQDDCVGVEREIVLGIIDASAAETVVFRVLVES